VVPGVQRRITRFLSPGVVVLVVFVFQLVFGVYCFLHIGEWYESFRAFCGLVQ
jgi:hypothetical protein